MLRSLMSSMNVCANHPDAMVTMEDVQNPRVEMCERGQYHFHGVLMDGKDAVSVREILDKAMEHLSPHQWCDVEMMRRVVLVCLLSIRRRRASQRG